MRFEVDRPVFEVDVRGRIKEQPIKSLPAVLVTPLSTLYDRPQLPDGLERIYLADLKSEGYSRGAVVVHSRLVLEKRIDPNEWGFVIGHNPFPPASVPMKLIKVKWANGSFEDCSEKELIIIHRPSWSSEDVLKLRVSKQPLK